MQIEAELERTVRDVLKDEQFGVLATAAEGRVHTATILFAETDAYEVVCAMRPTTLKARLSTLSPRATFHVDNRGVNATDRTRFARISFEGELSLLPRTDTDWVLYHDSYAAKLPFGGLVLDNPEVELYVLRTDRIRIAIGAQPACDYPVTPPPPRTLPPDDAAEAWETTPPVPSAPVAPDPDPE